VMKGRRILTNITDLVKVGARDPSPSRTCPSGPRVSWQRKRDPKGCKP
jgi:hypothetical protein